MRRNSEYTMSQQHYLAAKSWPQVSVLQISKDTNKYK